MKQFVVSSLYLKNRAEALFFYISKFQIGFHWVIRDASISFAEISGARWISESD